MRVITVTNTAVDLAAEKVPFLSSFTFAFNNPTAGELIVQEDDTAAFSDPSTVATVPAHGWAAGTPRKQFIRVSTAATVYGIGK